MTQYLLSIDQGTTSTRAMLFDDRGNAVFSSQLEFTQYFPDDGWVEHDPEEIWSTTLAVCREAIEAARSGGGRVVVIGITNQRETTVIWDRTTGAPLHRAVVWQSRQTDTICEELRADGLEPLIARRTGLVVDPYFSGTKAKWILDRYPEARPRAARRRPPRRRSRRRTPDRPRTPPNT